MTISLRDRKALRTKAEHHAERVAKILESSDQLVQSGDIFDSGVQVGALSALAHAQVSLAFSTLAEQGNW